MNLMRAGQQRGLWTRISARLTAPPRGAVVEEAGNAHLRPGGIAARRGDHGGSGAACRRIGDLHDLSADHRARGWTAGRSAYQSAATWPAGAGYSSAAAGTAARTDRQPSAGAVDLHRGLFGAFAAGGEGRRPAPGVGHDDVRRRGGDGPVARMVAAAPVHPPESAGLVVFLVGRSSDSPRCACCSRISPPACWMGATASLPDARLPSWRR